MTDTVKHSDNVNHILDSVSDKIIAKRKLKKTIIYSVILSVVVVLSSVIIMLASINANLQPNFLQGADAYRVYISNVEKSYIDEDSKNYEKFLEEYNGQFYTSILAGMFTGRLSAYEIQETNTQFYSNNAEKSGMSSTLKSELGSNYIKLIFNQERNVLNKNGSIYYSKEYTKDQYELKFKDCYLKLDSEDTDTMTFYLGTQDPDWGNKTVITKIVVKASSFGLYEYFTA
ncbi:MAG: hypothetical protein E7379_01020 [Clostridiales bacterium]|nr:hypothetical protein [Clostridiales bacterium]